MENPDIDRPAVHIGFPFFAALFFCFFCLSSIGNGRISCFPSSLPQPHSRCLQLQ